MYENKFPIEENHPYQNRYHYYSLPTVDGTYAIKGVNVEDIDISVSKAIQSDFLFEAKNSGKQIHFTGLLPLNRFVETMMSLSNVGDVKIPSALSKNTVSLPFVSLTREPLAEVGTRFNGYYNVPGRPTFPMFKVVSIKGGKEIVDYYKIPQPVAVDVKYKLSIITEDQYDLNKMANIVLHNFREAQYYISVNGHAMPVFLDSSADVSKRDDLNARRYFQIDYNLICKGYLINSNEIERVSSFDTFNIKIDDSIKREKVDVDFSSCRDCVIFNFDKGVDGLSTTFMKKFRFEYDDSSANMGVEYRLNNDIITFPFNVKCGDELIVTHKLKFRKKFKLRLCGKPLE